MHIPASTQICNMFALETLSATLHLTNLKKQGLHTFAMRSTQFICKQRFTGFQQTILTSALSGEQHSIKTFKSQWLKIANCTLSYGLLTPLS